MSSLSARQPLGALSLNKESVTRRLAMGKRMSGILPWSKSRSMRLRWVSERDLDL